MEESLPKVFKELKKILKKLEKHYKDMQDVEFTVENNKLWMLQTRSGKRTAKSAVKIAVDMVKEKLISKKEAVLRICLLYTSPSPRDRQKSRMPSSA